MEVHYLPLNEFQEKAEQESVGMEKIEKIKQAALDTGFWEAGEVPVDSLQFRPDIRKICEENSCRNYGTSWACPPAVGTLEDCRKRCEKYAHMLLFSGKFELEDSFDFASMVRGLGEFKKMTEQLDHALGRFVESYQILSNEGCGRCRKCTWPEAPCRFPDHLYHSIEGYGLLVSQLAKEAGIRYHNGAHSVTYFGAVLFD